MFNYDWTTDVLPVITQYTNDSLLKGAIIFIVAITLVSFAARSVVSVFWKRD